ncbi:MAG: vWA domain-containing protein, partial [Myxococcota bacterium]|nr:vWA domain-containing protein [Myxococcota bacterium]
EGRPTRTAGAVVTGLVREAARRRMRVAYVEFHHEAQPFRAGGRLFHRRYPALLARAAAARAEGRTGYEAPLRLALQAFGARPVRPEPGGRHVVLLSDGVPVVGDPTVGAERRLARRLGVRVHTVYMGADATPELLRTIARETGGAAFRAAPDAAGRLEVRPEPARSRAS